MLTLGRERAAHFSRAEINNYHESDKKAQSQHRECTVHRSLGKDVRLGAVRPGGRATALFTAAECRASGPVAPGKWLESVGRHETLGWIKPGPHTYRGKAATRGRRLAFQNGDRSRRDRLRPVHHGSAFLTVVDDTEVVPPICFGSDNRER